MASTNLAALLEEVPFKTYPSWVVAKLRPQAVDLIRKVHRWVEEECIPAEPILKAQLAQAETRWRTPPLIQSLRKKAKEAGLFNIFLPEHFKESPGLTNLEYSCCAELMGRCYWAAQTMNCHAPDTGNMELLAKYCSEEQKERWLKPLMEGEAFSGYSMTEPDVASSDATNIACRLRFDKERNEYVVNGRKLYGNCLWNEEVSFHILMACSDPGNSDPWRRHTMIIVPRDTPGLRQVRNLSIMGYDQ